MYRNSQRTAMRTASIIRRLGFGLVIYLASCAQPSWHEGQWRIVSAKFPGISALGVDDIAPLVGRVGAVSADSLVLDDMQCDMPVFSEQQVRRSAFEFDYRITFSDLGFGGESLSMVRAECVGSPTHIFSTLIQNNGRTYSIWEGTFILLERR